MARVIGIMLECLEKSFSANDLWVKEINLLLFSHDDMMKGNPLRSALPQISSIFFSSLLITVIQTIRTTLVRNATTEYSGDIIMISILNILTCFHLQNKKSADVCEQSSQDPAEHSSKIYPKCSEISLVIDSIQLVLHGMEIRH